MFRRISILVAAALAVSACGGDDDVESPPTTAPGTAEACFAARQTYAVAIEAWHAQYGAAGRPSEQDLIDAQFVRDDPTYANYVVIVDGQPQPGPACT